MARINVYSNYRADTFDLMDVIFADLPMGWGATQYYVNLALLRLARIEP